MYTIYRVTNKINQKVYIGFDSNWPNRKQVHKSSYRKQDYKFYRAIRKHGWDNFIWEPIYQSDDRDHTKDVMEARFIFEYDSYKNGYNSTLGGDGTLGLVLSEEAKRTIGEKNRFAKPQTPEHSRNISEALKRYYSTHSPSPVSAETRKKLSVAAKGKPKPMSEEHKKNLRCHTNNTTTITCPHCNKQGQLTNMKRWHFDKCKLNPINF